MRWASSVFDCHHCILGCPLDFIDAPCSMMYWDLNDGTLLYNVFYLLWYCLSSPKPCDLYLERLIRFSLSRTVRRAAPGGRAVTGGIRAIGFYRACRESVGGGD